MSEVTAEWSRRLSELRRDFDESFARPRSVVESAVQSLIEIRAAGNVFGLRLNEILGIELQRKRTFLPNELSGFEGVVGIRGRVIPVFSLGRLLGADERAMSHEPWLIICNSVEPVALSFERLEGCVTAFDSSWVTPSATSSGLQKHIHGLLRLESTILPVLQLSSIWKEISGNRENEEKR
jgi:chemotaxis signal transduction protein